MKASISVWHEGHDVRQSLFKQCVLGNIDAIKLWYQLYGKFIPTDRTIFDRGGQNRSEFIEDVSKLTDGELREIYVILERSAKREKVN
jgi:hypothetical protein